MEIPSSSATAVLADLRAHLPGIAVGHVPGLKLNRTGIALLGAIAMMIFAGCRPPRRHRLHQLADDPAAVRLLRPVGPTAPVRFLRRVAAGISAPARPPARFLLLLMLVTAGLSAFLNHDIVCFVFAPIVGAALLRRQINPVPFLIALAIASNIGAAATLSAIRRT